MELFHWAVAAVARDVVRVRREQLGLGLVKLFTIVFCHCGGGFGATLQLIDDSVAIRKIVDILEFFNGK